MNTATLSKDRIRTIMKEKGIHTQTELAEKMGITKNQLSVILSPKYEPIKSSVGILCDILGASLEEILDKDKYNVKHDHELENLFPDETIDISTVKALKKYNVVELFAGAGGLALGMKKAGLNAVGLVEIDKDCCNTLRDNNPKWNVIEGDIVEVAKNGIRKYIGNVNVDVLSGGYPCQAFSYAGKKHGLDDVRGTMFYYYAKILSELMPSMFLVENVRGLISHDSGKTLETMISVFKSIGYNVKYKLMCAVNYGVAQKRERVSIVGIRNDIHNVQYMYPKPFDYIPTLRDALKNVPDSLGTKYPAKKKAVLDLVPPGGCWRSLPEGIAKEYMGVSYYSGGGRTGMARRISWDEPSLTLTCSPAQKQTERCHPDETRPFKVREYARIQSFPDKWEFSGTISSQYKQIGNAVPVEFAKAIGLSIVNTLNQIESQNK